MWWVREGALGRSPDSSGTALYPLLSTSDAGRNRVEQRDNPDKSGLNALRPTLTDGLPTD